MAILRAAGIAAQLSDDLVLASIIQRLAVALELHMRGDGGGAPLCLVLDLRGATAACASNRLLHFLVQCGTVYFPGLVGQVLLYERPWALAAIHAHTLTLMAPSARNRVLAVSQAQLAGMVDGVAYDAVVAAFASPAQSCRTRLPTSRAAQGAKDAQGELRAAVSWPRRDGVEAAVRGGASAKSGLLGPGGAAVHRAVHRERHGRGAALQDQDDALGQVPRQATPGTHCCGQHGDGAHLEAPPHHRRVSRQVSDHHGAA